VLISVAHRRGAEASAHQVLAAEWAGAGILDQLLAEQESLVATASSERWHVASRRVLDRLGFHEGGRRREDRMIGGQWFDSVVCSLLEDEWRAVPPSNAG
jgi:RimJ/RimL family protein N-acetyltransferase